MGIILIETCRATSIMTLVGGIIILAVALVSAIHPSTLSQAIITLVGLSTGIGVIVGAFMIGSGHQKRVSIGAALAIVFGLASLIAGAGLIIGLVLSVSGGLIALLKYKVFR